jgi:hypothetical protein
MKATLALPSVVGRPPPGRSRPKDTSLGRGRGRCCEAVSSLSGGEANGEPVGDVDPVASSGTREYDMVAATGQTVGWVALGARR